MATKGLNFASFSDGYDDGFKLTDDVRHFMSSIKVARELHVPYALLWTQPAFVLDIYYYYLNGYGEAMNGCLDDPSCHEMYSFALPSFKEQLDALDADEKAMVLVNSFDALELEALKAIKKFEFIAIGLVLPTAFLDGKDLSDTSVGGRKVNQKGESKLHGRIRRAGNDSAMVQSTRSIVTPCTRMFHDALWMEFDVGEFRFKGFGCGISAMDKPDYKCKVDRRCMEDGSESKWCIRMVTRNEELRNNAKKWGDLATEAI
ncbi:hypothetical protein AgCh_038548 [Apium graveolens]